MTNLDKVGEVLAVQLALESWIRSGPNPQKMNNHGEKLSKGIEV